MDGKTWSDPITTRSKWEIAAPACGGLAMTNKSNLPLVVAGFGKCFNERGLWINRHGSHRGLLVTDQAAEKKLTSPFPIRRTIGWSSVKSMIVECSATIRPPSITTSMFLPNIRSISSGSL